MYFMKLGARRVLYPMLLLAAVASAQDADVPLFRAGVTLVRVDAQVVERNGRPVTDLTKDDFTVYDDGEPQPIAYFGRESEPLDVLLLLDISGSMQHSILEMAASARAALKQLNSGDRVAVMLFARRTTVAEEFTSDFRAVESELREALNEKGLGAGTLINASIISAAAYAGRQPVRGRRAILIVTDNEGLNYQTPDEDVLKALYHADVVLNAIVVRNGKPPAPPKKGQYLNPDFTPPDVFKLAEQSGGEALQGGRVAEHFPLIIERIRSRYAIQYAAPASAESGVFRKIQIELSPEARRHHRDALVRARAGYYPK
jgi:VWFA-related protein